jgi:ABC-type lipoprotein export system ATPase subunit
MANAFVTCHGLVKIYKIDEIEVVALQGLDLAVQSGEIVAIIGPSGAGKSTLLNVLGALDVPSAGQARVADVSLIKMPPKRRLGYRRATVGFVWQNVSRNLIPYLSAEENVQLPMLLAGEVDPERARYLLDLVGLGHRLHHKPRQMSGGEQQRVAIAVSLANTPQVLLADEPTGNLDSKNADRVLEVFRTVREEVGVTVVIVTHDMRLAAGVDRYVQILDGKTSTESVRRRGVEPASAASAQEAAAEESHDHYVLLDSAGRLQLPEDLRQSYGIRGRVKLVERDGSIIVVPGDESD